MTKITFIAKMVRKGFSLEEARIASMFYICCKDYGQLSMCSKKNLMSLVEGVKKSYKKSHKPVYRATNQPDVRALIIQLWVDCGYVLTDPSSVPASRRGGTN